MFVVAVIYLLILKLFLAGKDATSFLLKDDEENSLTKVRIKRWHRDGVALDVLSSVPIALHFGSDWWQIAIVSILLRLGIYDMAFNHWSKLSITFLGSTATFDRVFAKIFGEHGAIKKSIFFLGIMLIFCISKVLFKY